MKTQHVALDLAALLDSLPLAAAQGTTAFAYQGRLNLNGSPAIGVQGDSIIGASGVDGECISGGGGGMAGRSTGIQGSNEKVEERSQKTEIRIQKLETENSELKERLKALEKLCRALSS